MNNEQRQTLDEMLDELRKPFHPSRIEFKPGATKGERALALAYADLRAYMDRLDEVCASGWAVTYDPWGEDRIICRLTIAGVTRSSTGESDKESERSEIGGTVAESQSFKRAAAMFGLGRYLYNLPTVWADYDPSARQFTAQAKAKLTNALVQHYRRTLGDKAQTADPFATNTLEFGDEAASGAQPQPQATTSSALFKQFDALGKEIYGAQWAEVSQRNVHRISGGETEDAAQLDAEQIGKLISGMERVRSKRQPAAATAPNGVKAHA